MKHSLFGHRGAVVKTTESPIGVALENLSNGLNAHGPMVSREVAKAALAFEGHIDTRISVELNDSITNLQATIKQALTGIPNHPQLGKYNVAQEQAAITGAVAAYSPMDFLRREAPSAAALNAAYGGEFTTVIGHTGMSDAMENRSVDMQAFDERENRNAVQFTTMYNLQAARQDAFGEAFFPTVTIAPDSVGFSISIRLLYVYNEVRRDLSGSLSLFGRKNAIHAVIDPTILRNDQTRIVPVFRKTTPAAPTDSDAFFAADVGTTTLVVDDHPVVTGALAIGKKFDLMALGQTTAMLNTVGQLDQTDAIDSSIRLSAVYVKVTGLVGGVATTNVLKFDTSKFQTFDFNAAPQGNTRLMQLNATTDSLYVSSAKLAVDGTAPSLLAGLGTNTVRLSVSLFGSVLQDKGDTTVNAAAVEVYTVKDDTGNVLDKTSGTGGTIAALFATATVVGYDLIAYFTNSNKRRRGQLIDTQFQNYLYTVPLLPPITALRPVGVTEVNDSALLESLISLTHTRTSNAAVAALLEARDFLKDYVNTKDSRSDAPQILGVARFMVTPAYLEHTLDCLTNLDSLKSSDRTEDLQSMIINKLRDMAYRLYVTSGYQAALDALYQGAPPKITVIIGTDPILARYLNLTGDMRLMGDMFDFKPVTTLNQDMAGKIIFSFGMESSFNSGVPNPMHFGNMAWKPELTLMMPMIRNNASAMELTVQPSFRHVVNLPVLGSLTVTNLDSVIASKVPVYNHVVA